MEEPFPDKNPLLRDDGPRHEPTLEPLGFLERAYIGAHAGGLTSGLLTVIGSALLLSTNRAILNSPAIFILPVFFAIWFAVCGALAGLAYGVMRGRWYAGIVSVLIGCIVPIIVWAIADEGADDKANVFLVVAAIVNTISIGVVKRRLR